MSKESQESSGQPRRSAWRNLGGLLAETIKRLYSLALIVLVLWLSWRAVAYLVASLMLPARPPAQIVDIPTKLNESVVIRPDGGVNGGAAPMNQRSPLAHYHRLDEGFQFDRFNGCTVSQCHAPLPHGKNPADRAFLNMHATSLHCRVCHTQQDRSPLLLGWYDLHTGEARDGGPALLRAFAWLTQPSVRQATNFTTADQTEIVRLLRVAAKESYGATEVASLAEHLAAVRATSEEFVRLVQVTRDSVQSHFRGEYGAKLALLDPASRKPFLQGPADSLAVKEFLARRNSLSEEQKAPLLKRIHAQRRDPTLTCTGCHKAQGGLVDFRAVGYPPARIQSLASPQVTDAIQHIVEGRTFHLPSFLEPKN